MLTIEGSSKIDVVDNRGRPSTDGLDRAHKSTQIDLACGQHHRARRPDEIHPGLKCVVVEPALLEMLVGMKMTVDQARYDQAPGSIECLFRPSLAGSSDPHDTAVFD